MATKLKLEITVLLYSLQHWHQFVKVFPSKIVNTLNYYFVVLNMTELAWYDHCVFTQNLCYFNINMM